MKCPIVVGTDLTAASDEALFQAEGRATRDRAPLSVIHAASALPWGDGAPQLEELRALVRQRVSKLTGRSPDSYLTIVERGWAPTVLRRVAASQRAMLVVGAHDGTGLGHALLRDTAERLLLRAPGPLLVARHQRGSGRMLVAVDEPFSAAAQLDVAVDEARRSACTLTVMHCIRRGLLEGVTASVLEGQPIGQLRLDSRLAVTYQALRAELVRRQLSAEIQVVEGDPQRVIVERATSLRAELVVMGSSGRLGRTAHVALAVLRQLPCTALVAMSQHTLERPRLRTGGTHAPGVGTTV